MKELTIVIPCYNEGSRIEKLLNALILGWPKENAIEKIIFVDDGSNSSSRQKMLAIIEAKKSEFFFDYEVIELNKNYGKGYAIRTGFLKATTPIVGFMDADGATDIQSAANVYLELLQNPALSATLGSRILMLGKTIIRSARRHYLGRVFATIVSVMFDIKAYDTQCGCKFYRRKDILPLLDKITDNRWTWDTQLLVLLLKNNHTCLEVPVNWVDEGGSKVSFLRDPLKMLWRLIKFRLKS
jgi:dolichyl-phosphate beta-glucosyltransferase